MDKSTWYIWFIFCILFLICIIISSILTYKDYKKRDRYSMWIIGLYPIAFSAFGVITFGAMTMCALLGI